VHSIDFARAALPTFFTVLALVYWTRMAGTRARSGVLLQTASRPGTVQHVTHSLFRTLRIAIWLVTVIRVPWPEIDQHLGLFPALIHPVLIFAGLVLLLLGFMITSYVHHYMGPDWRSGVDEEAETELVTSGPFSWVRNPMFLGVVLAQLGFFFALPSIFSLVCFIIGMVAVLAQARFEERELARRFGLAYRLYIEHVPAWLPRRTARM
jgi:protein-S-isoprenylcysteine O-methyltransferase Ste14